MFTNQIMQFRFRVFPLLVLTACALRPVDSLAQSQKDVERDRNRGVVMLKLIKDYIKEYYYDPNYHGMDVDARFKAADDRIRNAANISEVLGIIAQAMVELNDSHTFFIPPSRPVDVDYGWKMQMIGDRCLVTVVDSGSDAEAQGLKPGDEVLSLNGFKPTRDNLWKMDYNFSVLHPQPGKHIVVRTPEGQDRDLAIKAKVEKRPKEINPEEWFNQSFKDQEDEKKLPTYSSLGETAVVWKLRHFDLTESNIGDMMKRARQRKALILDLRGNGGGEEVALQKLTGYFFDHDITIGEMKRRKESKPLKAKAHTDNLFKGQLVVLIDSLSASASELFARVIQLEKRGTVVGDRSSGAVMRSIFRPGALGDVSNGNMIFYGASITDADIVMADGKGLERVGVTPDEIVLPKPADLAAQRDPVLARAAALVGADISAEKAAAMFPLEKPKKVNN
ncbi:MAG TPA: S41 family peptidase [Pyrinomonadaceae bacterium]|nr:S41 family peptidase [Pyrinomonadaceae bacterium]